MDGMYPESWGRDILSQKSVDRSVSLQSPKPCVEHNKSNSSHYPVLNVKSATCPDRDKQVTLHCPTNVLSILTIKSVCCDI